MLSLKKRHDLLATWLGLNARLLTLSEHDVAALLETERAHRRRLTFLLRLHARLNRLRRARERRELTE